MSFLPAWHNMWTCPRRLIRMEREDEANFVCTKIIHGEKKTLVTLLQQRKQESLTSYLCAFWKWKNLYHSAKEKTRFIFENLPSVIVRDKRRKKTRNNWEKNNVRINSLLNLLLVFTTHFSFIFHLFSIPSLFSSNHHKHSPL